MKTIAIIILSVLGVNSLSIAQEVDLIWNDAKSNPSEGHFFFKNELFYIELKNKNDDYFFHKMDHKTFNSIELKPIFGKIVDSEEAKSYRFEKIMATKDQILFFTSKLNKKTDEIELFVRTITDKGDRGSKLAKVVSVTSEGAVEFGGKYPKNLFKYVFNEDSTSICIYGIPVSRKKNDRSIKLVTIDTHGDVSQNIDLVLPIEEGLRFYSEAVCYNDKDLYIFTTIEYNKDEKKVINKNRSIKNSLDFYSKLFYVDLNKKSAAGFESAFGFENENKILSNISFLNFGKQGVKIFGLCKNLNNESDYFDQYFISTIKGRSNSKPDFIYYDLPYSAATADRSFYTLKNYLKPDGSFITILESERIFVKTNNGNYAVKTYNTLGPILFLSISKDGKLDFSAVINKKESSVNLDGVHSSAAITYFNGKIYAIINKNINDDNIVECKPTIYVCDDKGNITEDLLINPATLDNYVVAPKTGIEITPGMLLVNTRKFNKIALSTVPENSYKSFILNIR